MKFPRGLLVENFWQGVVRHSKREKFGKGCRTEIRGSGAQPRENCLFIAFLEELRRQKYQKTTARRQLSLLIKFGGAAIIL